MRYVKIENGVVHSREVESHQTQLIAELLAYGWIADDGAPSTLHAGGMPRSAAMEHPVRGTIDTPPMTVETVDAWGNVVDTYNHIPGQPVDSALASATTMFEGEWPVGLPPEWFGPLKDKFGNPAAVVAASDDELLGLPGATHVTVAMLRKAFAGNIEE